MLPVQQIKHWSFGRRSVIRALVFQHLVGGAYSEPGLVVERKLVVKMWKPHRAVLCDFSALRAVIRTLLY